MLPSLAAAAVAACVQFSGSPAVSVIIDDLGYRDSADQATLELPAPLAVSILPFSPNGKTIAARAVATGHEVLLHLPMEAEQGWMDSPGHRVVPVGTCDTSSPLRK